MGRNAIPKLGEWRDGFCYRFSAEKSWTRPDSPAEGIPTPNDGRLIIYSRDDPMGSTILATAYADGFQECMASMWQSGFHKGEKAGYEKAKKEMRAALGLSE